MSKLLNLIKAKCVDYRYCIDSLVIDIRVSRTRSAGVKGVARAGCLHESKASVAQPPRAAQTAHSSKDRRLRETCEAAE